MEQQFDVNLIPPEGDKKVGTKVFQVVSEIIQHKISQGLHDKWLEHYRLSKNRPWKVSKAKVPLLSANLLHTHRQRTVNTLTDNNPTFNLARIGGRSEEGEEQDSMNLLLHAAEYWWREQEQQPVYSTSVNNGEMNGVAIEKTVFDPDLEFGIGEVATVNVDPYQFGVYPVTARDNQQAEANVHFYPMTLREARRMWPDKAKLIKPDAEILKELGEQRLEVNGEKTNSGMLERFYSSVASVFGADDKDGQDPRTLVIEMWVKDYSETSQIEEVEAEDEEGNATTIQMKVTKPKYPGHIRRITVCSAGKVVLDDRGNPSINPNLPEDLARQTFLFDKFPFGMVPSIEDSCSIWGMSDWEQLEGLQKEFNKTLSQFGYFKDKAVRPKVVNPKNSGVTNEQFTNALGVINPSNELVAQGIRYLEMNNAGLMAEISGALTIIKDLFFLVAGTFELEHAQTGNQVTAYKAIAALIEHAATMMRGKIRNYQKLIRIRGRMFLSHAMNWYTEERWISWEEDGETETAPIIGPQLIVPAKLTVVSGSTLPRAKFAQREEAIQLYEADAIDRIELLRVLEWPNRAEVVKRMQSGPVGMMVERMAALGLDEQRLQIIQQVGQMDDKEFKRALEKGELPMLSMGPVQGDPLQTLELQEKQIQLGIKEAERQKKAMEVVTERVKQMQAIKGIEYDQQMLEIERAKVMDQVAKGMPESEEGNPGKGAKNRPGYNERGMKSNNQEVTA